MHLMVSITWWSSSGVVSCPTIYMQESKVHSPQHATEVVDATPMGLVSTVGAGAFTI